MSTSQNPHQERIDQHLAEINREFKDGFEMISKFTKSVTIMGSSVLAPTHPAYKAAEELGGRIARELGYAVITGGGPGIMEAANKGTYEAGGVSIGFNIALPHESHPNSYLSHRLKFSYFFSRKAMLEFGAEAFVMFPGGFGTFDELFSVLTLVQTGKIPKMPIILYDSLFWNPLKSFIDKTTLRQYGTIDAPDMKLFHITDSLDEVIDIIKKAPVSEWWRNLN